MSNNRRIGASDKMLSAAIARRMSQPLVIKGVGPGKHVTMQPKDFANLRVDEGYQRVVIKQHANTLIHVLKSGGSIPDPVSIARRPNGDLYIVDGQQRFFAHLEAGVPMQAMIYPVDDIAAEKALFLGLNRGVRVGTEFIVHAWPGEMGEILRKVSDTPGHPLFDRINFGRHGRRLSAAILGRAMTTVLAGGRQGMGRIEEVLGRGDFALKNVPGGRARVEAVLTVLANVFGTTASSHMPHLAARAIASIARERWEARVVLPSPKTYERLRRVNWQTIVPSHSERYLPVMIAEVDRRWPRSEAQR